MEGEKRKLKQTISKLDMLDPFQRMSEAVLKGLEQSPEEWEESELDLDELFRLTVLQGVEMIESGKHQAYNFVELKDADDDGEMKLILRAGDPIDRNQVLREMVTVAQNFVLARQRVRELRQIKNPRSCPRGKEIVKPAR